ncbi:hypothetical protein PM03_14770 [Thalassobacter stenotrophicus]|nr:hypothetical protein PM03_14770 [Thalassobacter stenotrophicus]KGL00399.1 hypothetical protein PM04_14960 [Thalassobacter sp. 16PALIMAR09]
MVSLRICQILEEAFLEDLFSISEVMRSEWLPRCVMHISFEPGMLLFYQLMRSEQRLTGS